MTNKVSDWDQCVAELSGFADAYEAEFRMYFGPNNAQFILTAPKGRIWDCNGKRELRYRFEKSNVVPVTVDMLEEAMEGTDSFPM